MSSSIMQLVNRTAFPRFMGAPIGGRRNPLIRAIRRGTTPVAIAHTLRRRRH